jgi:uncharacterized membrane protein YhaH (DUF805 family)
MGLAHILFSPSGRIGRLTFLGAWLLLVVGALSTLYLSTIVVPDAPANIVVNCIGVIFLWPNIVVLLKRLQDRDHSLLFGLLLLIPFIGLWVLVEAFLLKGTNGPNSFGPMTGKLPA